MGAEDLGLVAGLMMFGLWALFGYVMCRPRRKPNHDREIKRLRKKLQSIKNEEV